MPAEDRSSPRFTWSGAKASKAADERRLTGSGGLFLAAGADPNDNGRCRDASAFGGEHPTTACLLVPISTRLPTTPRAKAVLIVAVPSRHPKGATYWRPERVTASESGDLVMPTNPSSAHPSSYARYSRKISRDFPAGRHPQGSTAVHPRRRSSPASCSDDSSSKQLLLRGFPPRRRAAGVLPSVSASCSWVMKAAASSRGICLQPDAG